MSGVWCTLEHSDAFSMFSLDFQLDSLFKQVQSRLRPSLSKGAPAGDSRDRIESTDRAADTAEAKRERDRGGGGTVWAYCGKRKTRDQDAGGLTGGVVVQRV